MGEGEIKVCGKVGGKGGRGVSMRRKVVVTEKYGDAGITVGGVGQGGESGVVMKHEGERVVVRCARQAGAM